MHLIPNKKRFKNRMKSPQSQRSYSTYQDLSNDTNHVKIGRWEPGVLGRQRGGDKVKNILI
jgi:hypothetical protein